MSRDRIVSAEGGGGEEKEFNWGLRPKNLDEYIGQKETVERLKIAIVASKLRGEPLDHLLLHGPPGLGKCISADSFILTEHGIIEFRDLLPQDMKAGESHPIQTQVWGLRGLEGASHVYCSGLTPTRKIQMRGGFELQGTPHHPVLVASPEGPTWKKLGELQTGDCVAVGRGMNVWGSAKTAIFQSATSPAKRARSKSSVVAVHGALTRELKRPPAVSELRRAYCATWNISDTPTPWKIACELNLPLSNGRQISTSLQTAPFALSASERGELLVSLDSDLGYLLGATVGDGHVLSNGGFVITCVEEQMQNELRRIAKKHFLQAPEIAFPKARAACLRFNARMGKTLAEFGLTCAKAREKSVPTSILAGPREAAIGFLQGVFDADGYSRPDGVEFSTRSKRLVQGVQLLLANIGIIASRTQKTVQGEPFYTLWMGGSEAVAFHREVGFRLTRKQTAFAPVAKEKAGWTRADIVPHTVTLLRTLLEKSKPHTRATHRAFEHVRSGDRDFSRRQIEKLLALLPDSVRTESEFHTLRALCDPRFVWQEVVQLSEGETETYDFVVPGSHSFLANGIYNHNTSLSYIIAEELGRDIALTSGPALERPGDVMGFLVNAREGDIIFIDEIHRLPRIVEEFLYSAMEDFLVNFTLDKGMYSKPLPIRLEKFTIVGATTRPAMLTRPLRDRFGLQQHFDFYTEDELNLIVRRSAHILDSPIDEHGAHEIARRSRGTPRVANRLLRRVRDFALVRADGDITLEVTKDALKLEGIDELGLDRLDHAVMNVIKDIYDGGPVGIEALAATLNEESDTLVDVVEPYLLKIGMLARTPAGRRITRRAYEFLGEPAPPSAISPQLSLLEEADDADVRLREIKRARQRDGK
ncbi:holliday junction ATP-dependent DNA helicase RuvB [Abditibacteriota bacterium]|nr:holliday junction ATP-dependent DNA helicase RuvB [Abditibacteriota bacterium]